MACKICGRPSGYYPLCKKCNQLKDNGKVEKCDMCGTWHKDKDPCKCTIKDKDYKNDLCIVCGVPSSENLLSCNICGKASGYYTLCEECDQLKDNREVEKCDVCGTWHKENDQCKCTIKVKDYKNDLCIVCGVPSSENLLCHNCCKEKEIIAKEFSHERSEFEIKKHYSNQKNVLYRSGHSEYSINGMLKLVAMAEELYAVCNDDYLKQIVEEDLKTIVCCQSDEKPHSKKQCNTFDDVDFRKQYLAEHQCDDGHYVRSYSEMLIDNWLYKNRIVHAYEKSVFMPSEPEFVVLSDFFIPDGEVYIEFWGLTGNEAYAARRKKKESLYLENEIPLISLEEKDIKRLNDVLPRKLNKYLPDKRYK